MPGPRRPCPPASSTPVCFSVSAVWCSYRGGRRGLSVCVPRCHVSNPRPPQEVALRRALVTAAASSVRRSPWGPGGLRRPRPASLCCRTLLPGPASWCLLVLSWQLSSRRPSDSSHHLARPPDGQDCWGHGDTSRDHPSGCGPGHSLPVLSGPADQRRSRGSTNVPTEGRRGPRMEASVPTLSQVTRLRPCEWPRVAQRPAPRTEPAGSPGARYLPSCRLCMVLGPDHGTWWPCPLAVELTAGQ